MTSNLYEKNIEELNKLKTTHPNLSSFWLEYMEKKRSLIFKSA